MKATDEVRAVEGPEVPGMQAGDPEHQVDISQSENEETEGPTKAEVEWHNLTHVPHAPWCSVCGEAAIVDTNHKELKQGRQ